MYRHILAALSDGCGSFRVGFCSVVFTLPLVNKVSNVTCFTYLVFINALYDVPLCSCDVYVNSSSLRK